MEKRDAWKQSREILNDLGLGGWALEFDRAKSRAGVCKHSQFIIGLSEYFVEHNPWSVVRETLLHEAAHALVGHAAGHGWKWQQKCLELGIEPNRCYNPKEVQMPKGNIGIVCPNHGIIARRHRMPKNYKYVTYRCTKCKEPVKVQHLLPS